MTRESWNTCFPIITSIQPLLNSGRVNLCGPNTPAIVQELAATNSIGEGFSGKSTSQSLQGKVSGEIMNLPAGSLAMAVGFEARKEKLTQTPAPVLATGDLSGFGGNVLPVSADRDVNAIYGELNIPILKTLEANVAVRTDDYSDFGRTTNPKASLRWQPSRDILLRSSYGKGFLAPSLYQLFTPQISGVSAPGTTDPVRCPVTHDTGLDCNTQFPLVFGGNPQLNPEKSEQATFGFVWEPTNQWSFSADYFKIRLNNAITNGIPVATILRDLAQFGGLVPRSPAPSPGFPNLPTRLA